MVRFNSVSIEGTSFLYSSFIFTITDYLKEQIEGEGFGLAHSLGGYSLL